MPKAPAHSPSQSAHLSRRELLAGASAGAAALLLERGGVQAQTPSPSAPPILFSHTSNATVDAVRDDVALAVERDTIAAIGPTEQLLRSYPNAEVYDGRGKALV